MPTKKPELSTTTLQLLFNDWLGLREVIAKITLTRKQKQQAPTQESPPFALLTETQIYDSFYGPYHDFIRTFSQAYALITNLRTRLIITQDENIKPHIKNSDIIIPENVKSDINAATLDKLQRALDELVRKHFTTWQQHLTHWQEQLVMQLMMQNMALSDLEIEDLSQPETLSELLDRFIELKLTPPKIKKDAYSFSDFFRAKTILVIHSAFSRQHQPYEMEHIQKVIKELKNDFKHIDKEEKQLSEAIEKDIHTTLQPLYN